MINEYGHLPGPWQRKWQACCVVYQRVLGKKYPKSTWERWAFDDIKRQYLRVAASLMLSQSRPNEP